MTDIGFTFLQEFEKLSDDIGEDIFKIISLWESLIIGTIVSSHTNDLGFKKLYNSTIQELDEILNEHYELFPDMTREEKIEKRNDILKTMLGLDYSEQDNLHLMLQDTLQKLSKAFGHPKLDIAEGLSILRELACKKVYIRNLNNV